MLDPINAIIRFEAKVGSAERWANDRRCVVGMAMLELLYTVLTPTGLCDKLRQ